MNENEVFENERNTVEEADAQKEFIRALEKVNSSYLTIVIVCACIAACGIAIALLLYLWLGVAVAFSSALVYMLWVKLTLRRELGISYESVSGALTVTKLAANGREEIFIPSRLLWINVTRIEDKAFSSEGASSVKSVHLPATLTEIGENVFEGADALERVYFEGTQEDWEKIDCATDFSGVELIFCDGSQYDVEKQPKSKKEKKAKQKKQADKEAVADKEDC